MGYDTNFQGEFALNKELDSETYDLLLGLGTTRRVARNVDQKYGVEGEFYTTGKNVFCTNPDPTIIDANRPPKTQPSLYCQWIPTDDRKHIVWDGEEKFYDYVEWIKYIIEKVLEPRNYSLDGEVEWQGEDPDDFGKICITNNQVRILTGTRSYEEEKEG